MTPTALPHTPLTAATLPSAGVAHNKILSKLASGLHKPSQQTLVPASAIPELLQDLPISKLRQLGGKFGEEVSNFTILTWVHNRSTAAKLHLTRFQEVWGLIRLKTEDPDGKHLD